MSPQNMSAYAADHICSLQSGFQFLSRCVVCMMFIIDTHDGAAALRYLPQCFVMAAVPPTSFSIRKQFLSLLPPDFSPLQTLICLFCKNKKTVQCKVSDAICEERVRQSYSGSVMMLGFQSYTECLCVGGVCIALNAFPGLRGGGFFCVSLREPS